MFENLDFDQMQTCVFHRWTPGIGDPTLAGWLTVLAYALCCYLAFRVTGRARKGRERTFWMLVALAMGFLALNKQLDLQSLLTSVARCVAQAQGWYADRRGVQKEFIEGLLAAIAAILLLALYLMRTHLRRNGLAIAGLVLVGGFVAIRAVSFHHFDSFLRGEFHSVRFNVILENSGLVLIALNALFLLRRRPGR